MDARVLKQFSKRMIAQQETNTPTFNWAHEKELLSLIKQGNIEELSGLLDKHKNAYQQIEPHIFYAEDLSFNAQMKSTSAFVLMSRAAIEGGVLDQIAYALCESYIYCAHKYDTNLFKDALFTFTAKVREFQEDKVTLSNGHIQAIKLYILKHLEVPFKIKELADAVYLSESRCSHKFKEATGMTIRQFTEQERLKAACILLEATKLPVRLISENFCFSSPSHFAAVFKQNFGITPNEYRKVFIESGISGEKKMIAHLYGNAALDGSPDSE